MTKTRKLIESSLRVREALGEETYTYEDEDEVRDAFWRDHPEFARFYRDGRRQNAYNTDIRTAWVDYVDRLARNGDISEELAFEVTL